MFAALKTLIQCIIGLCIVLFFIKTVSTPTAVLNTPTQTDVATYGASSSSSSSSATLRLLSFASDRIRRLLGRETTKNEPDRHQNAIDYDDTVIVENSQRGRQGRDMQQRRKREGSDDQLLVKKEKRNNSNNNQLSSRNSRHRDTHLDLVLADNDWDSGDPFLGGPVGRTPPWKETINTATYINKFDGAWFIVDCWHHRILVSNTLNAPLSMWGTLQIGPTDELIVPHSMATDGRWIVTESSNGGSNGDNHTVIVFAKDEKRGKFVYHQTVLACPGNTARRPHRIIYHAPSKAFFLYLTNPPHLSKFSISDEGIKNEFCKPLPAVMNAYARSITIVKDSLYVSAGRAITEMNLETLELKRYYNIAPLKIKSEKMNDLTFIDGWWYITSTLRCNVFRVRDLDTFEGIQILTRQLDLCYDFDRTQKRCRGGTPYYVTKVAGRIFVPYIFHCSGVVSFVDDPVGDGITDIKHHWGNGFVETPQDIAVRGDRW